MADETTVRTNETQITKYGFTFGPLNVERVSATDRGVCLKVETGTQALYIYATPAGRSLRVFRGNRDEMVAPDA